MALESITQKKKKGKGYVKNILAKHIKKKDLLSSKNIIRALRILKFLDSSRNE
jgi:hypothetical protein